MKTITYSYKEPTINQAMNPAPTNDSSTRPIETWLDKVGIWLSGLCLIHCVGTVVALALLPVLSFNEATHEYVHIVLAVILPTIALLAFIPGYRRHHDKLVIALGVLGVALIIFAAAEPLHGFSHIVVGLVTSCGSVALITAHVRNRRLNRCRHSHHAHC